MPPSKDNEFSLSPEIDRLSSQLAKDPKSKLFMPLAEEYIKAGMAEEAIMTLEEGLKVHPSYMSARVLLGKAFLEKNDLENARVQFETVVRAIPDNLFAHKKLGEVFKGLGMRAEAIKSYKMVLILHPKDADARMALDMLEGGIPAAQAQPEEVKPAQPAPKVFDLSDLGGDEEAAGALEETEPELPETSGGPSVMEMPVPEMETLEQVKRAQAAEEPESSDEAGDFGFAAEAAVAAGEDEEDDFAPPAYEIQDEGGFEFAADAPVAPAQDDTSGDAFTWGGEGGEVHELAPEVESDVFDLDSSPLVMEDEHFEEPILAPAHEYIAPASSDDAFSWGGEGGEAHELTPEVESDVFDLDSSPLVMEEEHFETPAPKPAAASGYAIDLGEVKGVKDIFDAYKDDSTPERRVGENEEVYEIPDDISAFAMEGFKLEPPKFEPEPPAAVEAMPEPEPPEPPARPAKELFETETLAELYVSQGFYDRALNIYKSLSMERPDDLTIKQKLQELYQLAHLSATMGDFGMAGGAGAAAPAHEEYTPVDFEAVEAHDAAVYEDTTVSDGMADMMAAETVPEADLWAAPMEAVPEYEVPVEEAMPEAGFADSGFMEAAQVDDDAWGSLPSPDAYEQAGLSQAAPATQADPLAVGRLEGLLDKIRRKRAS